MRKRPIMLAPQAPAPSATEVRAASFLEDQTPPENSFLGRYYRPNRNIRSQNQSPAVAAGGGAGPKAPQVTQTQPNNADAKMGQKGYALGGDLRIPAASPKMVSGDAKQGQVGYKTSVSTSISAPNERIGKTGGRAGGKK